MDTDENIADELIILVERGDIGDHERISEIMGILRHRTKLEGNDFPALEAGEEYLEEMQQLLDEQKQRQNQ